MFAIRARRKVATERDFLDAVEKVVRQGTKFSSTYVQCCPPQSSGTDVDHRTGHFTKCTIRFVVFDSFFLIYRIIRVWRYGHNPPSRSPDNGCDPRVRNMVEPITLALNVSVQVTLILSNLPTLCSNVLEAHDYTLSNVCL